MVRRSLYRSEYNPYFKTNSKLFPAIGFLVDFLQHLPDVGAHLVRRYGLYSSRSRGTGSCKPHLLRLAPDGWKEQHRPQSTLQLGEAHEHKPDRSVSAMGPAARKALRGGSLRRQQVEALREPPALHLLRFPYASARHHHGSPAGPQDPPSPHQDRSRSCQPAGRRPAGSPGSGLCVCQLNVLTRSPTMAHFVPSVIPRSSESA